MKDCGPSTQLDMVDAFLRAEINSPRFAPQILARLKSLNVDRDALFSDANARIRPTVLAYRGYGLNQALFAGFPNDIAWRRIELDRHDMSRLRYCSSPPWPEVSGGSRRVTDGAQRIESLSIGSTREDVLALAQSIREGTTFPELIAVASADESMILVEGHTRATAHAYADAGFPLRLIVGRSPDIARWQFH
jgi:hypothetical protein